MGTFLKYLVLILILVALFIVGKGIYDGSITSDTTVGSVANQVDAGAKTMARDAADAVGKAVDKIKKKGDN